MAERRKAAANAPDAEVAAFLATLEHPQLDAIRAVREVILAADASIGEGIKWKVPSFRTTEYFATLHLRTKTGFGVILHFGAKKRDDIPSRGAIADPAGVLQWLADDRAMVSFTDVADVRAKSSAFTTILQQWITHV